MGRACGCRSLAVARPVYRCRCLSLSRGVQEGAMRLGSVGAGVAAWLGAALSSLCCLLPLTIIVLGLGSGAFMAVPMRDPGVLVPAGGLGDVAGVLGFAR